MDRERVEDESKLNIKKYFELTGILSEHLCVTYHSLSLSFLFRLSSLSNYDYRKSCQS